MPEFMTLKEIISKKIEQRTVEIKSKQEEILNLFRKKYDDKLASTANFDALLIAELEKIFEVKMIEEKSAFHNPSMFFLSDINPLFLDKDYFKNNFINHETKGNQIYKALQLYFTDKEDNQSLNLLSLYWNYISDIVLNWKNITPTQKKNIRFSFLAPSLLKPEDIQLLGRSIEINSLGEPVLYLDEWIDLFLNYSVPFLDTSTIPGSHIHLQKIENPDIIEILKLRKEITKYHKLLQDDITNLIKADALLEKNNTLTLDDEKLDIVQNIYIILNNIFILNESINKIKKNMKKIEESTEQNNLNLGLNPLIEHEVLILKQIALILRKNEKNPFSLLSSQKIEGNLKDKGFRENALKILVELESIDPSIFKKNLLGKERRFPPYLILFPSCSSHGLALNLVSYNTKIDRGYVIVPMFAPDFEKALIFSLAEYKWKVLTTTMSIDSNFIESYKKLYLKYTDEKDFLNQFCLDYYHWIVFEARSQFKLSKNVQSFFWKEIPFSRAIKDKIILKNPMYKILDSLQTTKPTQTIPNLTS